MLVSDLLRMCSTICVLVAVQTKAAHIIKMRSPRGRRRTVGQGAQNIRPTVPGAKILQTRWQGHGLDIVKRDSVAVDSTSQPPQPTKSEGSATQILRVSDGYTIDVDLQQDGGQNITVPVLVGFTRRKCILRLKIVG